MCSLQKEQLFPLLIKNTNEELKIFLLASLSHCIYLFPVLIYLLPLYLSQMGWQPLITHPRSNKNHRANQVQKTDAAIPSREGILAHGRQER